MEFQFYACHSIKIFIFTDMYTEISSRYLGVIVLAPSPGSPDSANDFPILRNQTPAVPRNTPTSVLEEEGSTSDPRANGVFFREQHLHIQTLLK